MAGDVRGRAQDSDGEPAVLVAEVHEVVELGRHHPRRCGEAPNGEFVDHYFVGGPARLSEKALPSAARFQRTFGIEVDRVDRSVGLHARSGKGRDLQQSGQEGQLVLADLRRTALKVGVEGLALAHLAAVPTTRAPARRGRCP